MLKIPVQDFIQSIPQGHLTPRMLNAEMLSLGVSKHCSNRMCNIKRLSSPGREKSAILSRAGTPEVTTPVVVNWNSSRRDQVGMCRGKH